ncbi:glycoside hydrolase family 13 protein [Velocimicrobium porci]|uniref:Alpha-glycosidase n=1 Tax=Velocimicrobium porci TaxID=2606634 RepID=A0A6L5XY91_9FIRM|nr:glycoside hydrolase family 13 protein [Velocimicrobium porci]MSS63421.1 alpha-glycosidase [Velocimicrobium porci]
MEFGAIYHRASDNYCYPLNEEELIINLKTGYDIERVYLYYGDPYSSGIMGGAEKWNGIREEIYYKKRLKHHIWWTTTLRPRYKRCKYYFELHTKTECVYYFEDGFYTKEEIEKQEKSPSYFTFPWMNPIDINKTPDWVNETIWYQIFPERYCNGNPAINPKGVKQWKYEKTGVYDYYGGDISGIDSKLDYLHNLGITGIYFTPLFEADSNHKYNTKDYYKVDSHFGTNEELKQLVKHAHQKGIRVMFDGVFNHTGTDFFAWRDVMEKGEKSRYYNWYMLNQWPVDEETSTEDGRYYTFAFASHMPKLNTNCEEVIEYILNVVKYWIQQFDIDGLRLDVANEVSHYFLKRLRKMVKKEKPDFYLLGEIWGDSISWLRGDEFDSVMNYPLASGISDYWIYKNWKKEEFEHAINRCFTMYMQQTNDVLFNLLDSHDTNRLMDKVKEKDIFYQQLAVLYTMPGSPCIYYGTEIAMEGAHDPDCRRCMPWEEIEKGTYDEEIEQIKTLIKLRKSHAALRSRNFHFPNTIDDDRVVEYIKLDGQQSVKVIMNCGEHAVLIKEEGKVVYNRNLVGNQLKKNGIVIIELKEKV